MAHFKRGKCRRNCPHALRGSMTSWRAKHGFTPKRIPDDIEPRTREWHEAWNPPGLSHLSIMRSCPAWWDRVFHVRPKRRAAQRMLDKVKRGELDADDAAWPLSSRKPTQYYW